MKLLEPAFFLQKEKHHRVFLALWFVLCVLSLIAYIFSFASGKLYVSILAGIIAVIVCVLFYFIFVFRSGKLVKLYKTMRTGIQQEDTYTFDSFDDLTEHDGVLLKQLNFTFEQDGQIFDRTLYVLNDLPAPELHKGDVLTVVTHQNIILEIK